MSQPEEYPTKAAECDAIIALIDDEPAARVLSRALMGKNAYKDRELVRRLYPSVKIENWTATFNDGSTLVLYNESNVEEDCEDEAASEA